MILEIPGPIEMWIEDDPVENAKANAQRERFRKNADWLQARQKVPVKVFILREIRCQIPVVPAVIAAQGDLGLAGVCPRDAYGYRRNLPARARVPYLRGPWMQAQKLFRKLNFF